jgi:hypothetical protein
MPIDSLVPRMPHYAGAVDASGIGCGSFWVATTYSALPQPIVFREKIPLHIQQQLVSASNPSGSLTNSDLELSAVALGVAALQDHAPLSHACLYTASDNTPTVSWCHKGSTSSIGANAYLLHCIAQLARASSLTLKPISVPGDTNLIADFCSCSFHMSDLAFLQALHAKFPMQPSWKLVHLKPEHVHSWIPTLSCKTLAWPCATPTKMDIARPQMSGTNFATPSPWTHPCHHVQTPYPRCSSSPIVTEVERLLPAALRSVVKRWVTPFVPWARRSPAWDCRTPALPHLAKLLYATADYSVPTTNKIAPYQSQANTIVCPPTCSVLCQGFKHTMSPSSSQHDNLGVLLLVTPQGICQYFKP